MTSISIALGDAYPAAFDTWVECDVFATNVMEPGVSYETSSGAVSHEFFSGSARVALTVGAIAPSHPSVMVVSRCVAAVWRITARRRLRQLSVHCAWLNPTSDAKGGPSPGEGLDALVWETGGGWLALGTEDGDFLARRAENGSGIPARLASEFGHSTIAYTGYGLVVPVSVLESGETLELHFIAAWEDRCLEDDVSAWLAAEQEHAYVVRALGVAGSTP